MTLGFSVWATPFPLTGRLKIRGLKFKFFFLFFTSSKKFAEKPESKKVVNLILLISKLLYFRYPVLP